MNQVTDITNKLKPLRPFLPYMFALAIIGLFGYTGWTINSAFSPAPQINGSVDRGKVRFDQTTINAVTSLYGNGGAVQGDTTSSDGTNPFGQ
jgi:hypothetical protein